jgi:hypothetical protein
MFEFCTPSASPAIKVLSGEFREGETLRADRGRDGLAFEAATQAQAVEA